MPYDLHVNDVPTDHDDDSYPGRLMDAVIDELADTIKAVHKSTDWDVIKEYNDLDDQYIRIRLQWLPPDTFRVWTGSPGYDTDHRGFWGTRYLLERDQIPWIDIAHDLIDDSLDHFYQLPVEQREEYYQSYDIEGA